MSESEFDSGSASDSSSSQTSERRKAARDRLAPKTQLDYASIINCLKQFALQNRATFSNCIESGTNNIILPVPLALGEAYLCHLRDKLVPWPHDPRPTDSRTCLKHYSRLEVLQRFPTFLQTCTCCSQGNRSVSCKWRNGSNHKDSYAQAFRSIHEVCS
jgi:hypothetical protein